MLGGMSMDAQNGALSSVAGTIGRLVIWVFLPAIGISMVLEHEKQHM
jgi:hypothetical protein